MGDRSVETKAKQIFQLDKRIRFIAVVTTEGEVISEVFAPGVTSLEPESDTRLIYTRAGIAFGMSTPMDKHHGRVKSVMINREKVTIMMFNQGSKMVLVSAEPGFEKVWELGRAIESSGLVA